VGPWPPPTKSAQDVDFSSANSLQPRKSWWWWIHFVYGSNGKVALMGLHTLVHDLQFQKLCVTPILLTPKISGLFWWILGLKHVENKYLLTCGPMIKMKLCFSTSNHKILYLTMLIVCRKNLSQSNLMDCNIITNEGE
jgi:hypothetical protein